MRIRWMPVSSLSAAVLVLWSAASGCAAAKPRPVAPWADFSTPRAAGLTYLRGIAAADITTAKAACVGTDEQKKSVDAIISMVDGMRRLDEAIVRRFGPNAEPHGQLREVISHMTDETIAAVQEGAVRQSADGSSARILPARMGMRVQGIPEVLVRKVGEKTWKVDLPAMRAGRDPKREAERDRAYARVGDAMREVARRVRAGKYATVEAAEDALAERMPRSGLEPAPTGS